MLCLRHSAGTDFSGPLDHRFFRRCFFFVLYILHQLGCNIYLPLQPDFCALTLTPFLLLFQKFACRLCPLLFYDLDLFLNEKNIFFIELRIHAFTDDTEILANGAYILFCHMVLSGDINCFHLYPYVEHFKFS